MILVDSLPTPYFFHSVTRQRKTNPSICHRSNNKSVGAQQEASNDKALSAFLSKLDCDRLRFLIPF